jgi:hypothetical protein
MEGQSETANTAVKKRTVRGKWTATATTGDRGGEFSRWSVD